MTAVADTRIRHVSARLAVHALAEAHIRRPGPINRAPVEEILVLLASLPGWPDAVKPRNRRLTGVNDLLRWLVTLPGDGWQQRWDAAETADLDWVATLVSTDTDRSRYRYDQLTGAVTDLLLLRLAQPSYLWLARCRAFSLYQRVRQTWSPELFSDADQAVRELGTSGKQANQALTWLAKMLLHTGKNLDELAPADFFEARAASLGIREHHRGFAEAWDICRQLKILPGEQSMRAALRLGQRSTAELVDRHRLVCTPVRDVIVRYCEERRPALDYSSLGDLVRTLARYFWADLERHHPGINSLHLPAEVARGWKQRVSYVDEPGHGPRPRHGRVDILTRVRAFYLDMQQWALEDPSWVPWAVPSPVRKTDTEGLSKVKKRARAEMHQRVRDRLPHLPVLVEAADRHRRSQSELLDLAARTEPGETFAHQDVTYRRIVPKTNLHAAATQRGPDYVHVENLSSGARLNLTLLEDQAFWPWAIIETLRHTGVRIEELLEIRHLALVSYTLPDTGEVVPLLKIVPPRPTPNGSY